MTRLEHQPTPWGHIEPISIKFIHSMGCCISITCGLRAQLKGTWVWLLRLLCPGDLLKLCFLHQSYLSLSTHYLKFCLGSTLLQARSRRPTNCCQPGRPAASHLQDNNNVSLHYHPTAWPLPRRYGPSLDATLLVDSLQLPHTANRVGRRAASHLQDNMKVSLRYHPPARPLPRRYPQTLGSSPSRHHTLLIEQGTSSCR